ncbi:SLC13 family permease [uncultured Oscillibacter sp.]|uniref:SLC13 family permease n=1 Tax=uncultured Oscillibacter sp. TaxID=876091 RepID=UPI0025CF3D94|nr:SLC13 family permease [uncultured Oscillibacter sp.]
MLKTIALIVFIAVYGLLLLLPKYRAAVAVAAAVVFLALGIVPAREALSTIDWNVLLMLAGTMGTVDLFIRSKMPNRLSDKLVRVLPSVKALIIVLALFAGFVSAFVDNVATVLMLAPVGMAIAKKLRISPVAPILAIAVSSNLQGAATLVGDTTSILLSGHMGMDFMDFFAYKGAPGMFWVVQAGAVATVPVMMFLFRKEKGALRGTQLTPVTDYLPSFCLLGTVAGLILASFLPEKPGITNGAICMAFFAVGLAAECVRHRDAQLAVEVLKGVDYVTLLLLAGLFLVIDGINRVGIIGDVSQLIAHLGGGSLFWTYTIIVWFSVLASAFIDNIPYTATMLPVVGGVAAAMGVDQAVLCFGLLTGATLGGNLTPVGASANIAAGGILRKAGYEVSTGQFMRIGVPFTLVAVTVGYLLVWAFCA